MKSNNVESKGEQQPTQDRETDRYSEAIKLGMDIQMEQMVNSVAAPTIPAKMDVSTILNNALRHLSDEELKTLHESIGSRLPGPTISGGAGEIVERYINIDIDYSEHDAVDTKNVQEALASDIEQYAREVAEKEVKEAIVAFDVWRQENEYELNVRDQKVPAYTTSELYSLYQDCLTKKNNKA